MNIYGDNQISKLFTDRLSIQKIQNKLPKLFQLAELESSRAGKIGMEVGSVREKIIIALLIYKFGESNVETKVPITEPEVDVRVFNNPLSIKTITGSTFGGIKLIWTVDATKAIEFANGYKPSCDMILAQINWSNEGGLYYIPKDVQLAVHNEIGKNRYIKLPKAGTNPRGVEMTAEAMKKLINNSNTFKILINWEKENISFAVYKRWIDLWRDD